MNEGTKKIICRGVLVTVFLASISPLVCDHCGYEHIPHIPERSPIVSTQSTIDYTSTFTTSASGTTHTTTTLPPPNYS